MTPNEAIEEIISERKYYVGIMPQSTASNFVASWRKNMAKKKTIDAFLMAFGYKLKTEEQWEKN